MRWLRPEFQNPAGKGAPTQETIALELEDREAAPAPAKKQTLPTWPKELREQVASVRELVTVGGRAQRTWSTEEVARAFKGSRRADVASVLEALGALGLILGFDTPAGRMWRAAMTE